MSLTYITRCDGCNYAVDEWPEGSAPFGGWAHVELQQADGLSPQRFDYCPECWKTMSNALIKAKEQRAAERQWQENQIAQLIACNQQKTKEQS